MVDPGLNTSPQFTLTCSSTGGPATTVTWTRDSVPVSGDMMTAFNGDTSDPQYIHTLTVTGKLGGLYTCTVANNKPSEDSAQFTVQGMHNKKWRLTLSPECVYTPPAPFPPSGVDCVSEWSGQCTSLLDTSIRRTYCNWLHHLLPAARWRT